MTKVFKVIGVEKVIANCFIEGKKLDSRAAKAITDEGNSVLQKSMDQCPVETGTLRRSATLSDPKVSGNNVFIEIGYNTTYAIYVHERLNAKHPIGKAKFLEDPVREAQSGFAFRVAARMGTL